MSILGCSSVATTAYTVHYKKRLSTTDFPLDTTFASVGEIDAQNGVRVRKTRRGEEITSNSFGEGTVLDEIHQGEEMFLDLTLKQTRNSAAQDFIFQSSFGDPGVMAVPGMLASCNFAGQLLLKPAYTTTPAWNDENEAGDAASKYFKWFQYVFVTNGHEIAYALKAGLLVVPISLRVLPYADLTVATSGMRFWEYTNLTNPPTSN